MHICLLLISICPPNTTDTLHNKNLISGIRASIELWKKISAIFVTNRHLLARHCLIGPFPLPVHGTCVRCLPAPPALICTMCVRDANGSR